MARVEEIVKRRKSVSISLLGERVDGSQEMGLLGERVHFYLLISAINFNGRDGVLKVLSLELAPSLVSMKMKRRTDS